jgi:hypothetical protein
VFRPTDHAHGNFHGSLYIDDNDRNHRQTITYHLDHGQHHHCSSANRNSKHYCYYYVSANVHEIQMGSATESDCHKDDSHYEYGNKAVQDAFDTLCETHDGAGAGHGRCKV